MRVCACAALTRRGDDDDDAVSTEHLFVLSLLLFLSLSPPVMSLSSIRKLT